MSYLTVVPLRAAALAVAVASFSGTARAAATDYAFEVLNPVVRPSRDAADLRVRLVRVSDGQAVAGAPVSVERFGMWRNQPHKAPTPPWMAHAAGPAVAEAGGTHRLPAELTMPGTYRLTLSAMVPGEAEPVRGTVVVRAPY